MAAVTPPFVIQAASHPATSFRQMVAAAFGVPTALFAGGVQATTAGGGHGVIAATDMAVSQNGTPNMSVNVAAGYAAITGTQAVLQGAYTVANDAVTNLVIAAADPTNPRRDLICAQVRDAAYSGASNDFRLVVITGTPAASPVDPSLSSTQNALVLGRARVSAADTSITSGEIDDLRTRAYTLGGCAVVTSTTRPTGVSLYAGLNIFETDTFRRLEYDGTGWVIMSEPRQAWTPTASWTVGNGTWVAGFRRDDGYCSFDAVFTFGTTSSIAGTAIGGLPVAAAALPGAAINCGFEDTGTDFTTGVSAPVAAAANTVTLRVIDTNLQYARFANTSGTIPHTWTTGDKIHWSGRFPMNTRYL